MPSTTMSIYFFRYPLGGASVFHAPATTQRIPGHLQKGVPMYRTSMDCRCAGTLGFEPRLFACVSITPYPGLSLKLSTDFNDSRSRDEMP